MSLSPAPEREQLLSVTVRSGGPRGQTVVEVVGEVDAYTAPVLDACLTSQSRRPGLHELAVEMRQVTFLGAAGVTALAQADRRCRMRGARLVIRTGGRRAVLRPLQLTGLGELVALEQRPPGRAPREATRPRRRLRRGPARHSRRGCRGADASR